MNEIDVRSICRKEIVDGLRLVMRVIDECDSEHPHPDEDEVDSRIFQALEAWAQELEEPA